MPSKVEGKRMPSKVEGKRMPSKVDWKRRNETQEKGWIEWRDRNERAGGRKDRQDSRRSN